MENFLSKEYEVHQLLVFQGRFGGVYALIVPHLYATKVREVLTEGAESAFDYEVVIEAEKLFVDEGNRYPGTKARTIAEALKTLEDKLNSLDHDTFFELAGEYLDKLEQDYGI